MLGITLEFEFLMELGKVGGWPSHPRAVYSGLPVDRWDKTTRKALRDFRFKLRGLREGHSQLSVIVAACTESKHKNQYGTC